MAVYTVIIRVAAVVFDQAVVVDSPLSHSIMYVTRTFPKFKCILAPLHAFRFRVRGNFISSVFASAGTMTRGNFSSLSVHIPSTGFSP